MERFHWADYLIFAIMLLLSAAVGVYYRIKDRKKLSAANLQLGDRTMTLLPVTFSVVASFMSAISILGTTAEIYTNGAQYFMLGLSYFIAFPLAAEVYMPMFYRLRLTSAHEVRAAIRCDTFENKCWKILKKDIELFLQHRMTRFCLVKIV